jgi:hypothetical protein
MRLAACKENPELLNCPLSLRQAKRQGKFRLLFIVNKSGFCEVGLDDRKEEITVSDTTLSWLASMEQSSWPSVLGRIGSLVTLSPTN